MKSIFDKNTKEEILQRIHKLNASAAPLWGEMTVAQMVRHCSKCDEYFEGYFKVKRSPIGEKIGSKIFQAILVDENPGFMKSSQTDPEFIITETDLDLETEKNKWISLIEKHENLQIDHFEHWFFGDMNKAQLGQLIYRHADHHLRQFEV